MQTPPSNSTINSIKLNTTIIPTSPFLWYREEELTCTFDHICKVSKDELSKICQAIIPPDNLSDNCYIIIQKHILSDANIYICNHSFAFINDPNNTQYLTNQYIEIPSIPPSFVKDYHFNVYCQTLNLFGYNSTIVNQHLQNNTTVGGSVLLHGSAFSPPGCFHFKINNVNNVNINNVNVVSIYTKGTCDEIKKDYSCLFIIINETTEKQTENDQIMENIYNEITKILDRNNCVE